MLIIIFHLNKSQYLYSIQFHFNCYHNVQFRINDLTWQLLYIYLINFAFLRLLIELKWSRKLQVWKSGLKWLTIFVRYMYPTDLIHLPPRLYIISTFLNHTTWRAYLFYFIHYHTEHKINLHFNSFVFQNDIYQFKWVYEFKLNNNCHVYNSS